MDDPRTMPLGPSPEDEARWKKEAKARFDKVIAKDIERIRAMTLIELLREEQGNLSRHDDADTDPIQDCQQLLLDAADALERREG